MDQETYQCYCKGCSRGFKSEFSAAPDWWFIDKGLNLPRNCPTCREWIRSQTDEAIFCDNCHDRMAFSAKRKISHHKKSGPWIRPTTCEQCNSKDNLGPAFNEEITQPEEIHREEEAERRPDFSRIAEGIVVRPRVIAYKVSDYTHPVHTNSTETRQMHLEGHIASSPNSQVGQHIKGRGRPQSPTAFDDGDGDFRSFLEAVRDHMLCDDPNTTREYMEGNRIIRLTLLPNGMIEKTIIRSDPGPNGHEVISTFDSITVQKAISTYGRKS